MAERPITDVEAEPGRMEAGGHLSGCLRPGGWWETLQLVHEPPTICPIKYANIIGGSRVVVQRTAGLLPGSSRDFQGLNMFI